MGLNPTEGSSYFFEKNGFLGIVELFAIALQITS